MDVVAGSGGRDVQVRFAQAVAPTEQVRARELGRSVSSRAANMSVVIQRAPVATLAKCQRCRMIAGLPSARTGGVRPKETRVPDRLHRHLRAGRSHV
jgi:hypothetical protein